MQLDSNEVRLLYIVIEKTSLHTLLTMMPDSKDVVDVLLLHNKLKYEWEDPKDEED